MNASTPSLTAQQHFALIKHLAGGKDLNTVALIFKITPDQVRDIAKNHGYPDTDRLARAADILAKKLEQNDQLTDRPLAAGGMVTSDVPGRVIPTQTPGTLPPVRPDEVRVLINTAKAHPSKRIQTAGDRLIDAIDKLKDLIHEDQEKHAERRKAEAAKAEARAEVERLEQQLAAAKAKLRKKTSPPSTSTGMPATKKAATNAPRGEYPCRNEGCGKVIDTPQGRGLHERQHCEHRPEAAAS